MKPELTLPMIPQANNGSTPSAVSAGRVGAAEAAELRAFAAEPCEAVVTWQVKQNPELSPWYK